MPQVVEIQAFTDDMVLVLRAQNRHKWKQGAIGHAKQYENKGRKTN